MELSRRRAIASLAAALLATPAFALGTTRARARGLRCWTASGPDVEAFLRAVEAGDLAAVRKALAADASLAAATDAGGRSAFVLAHLAGQLEVAGLLRESGLELDIVEAVLAEDWERMEALAEADPGLANALHPIGGTPLYAAALNGSLDLWRLRYLGCDTDLAPAGGSGLTPARGALNSRTLVGAYVAATDVLSNGGDVNARQRSGDSVLHGAVRRRDERLVRLAVRKGAATDARDEAGRSARDLALELDWEAGAQLLAHPERLPRDHRASRFAFDANREPIRRPDLSAVPQELQSKTTGNSHGNLKVVREMLESDPRLVFSISTDDELAIEACAHTGNHDIIRYHLDHGSPFSLPTAVSLGDQAFIRFLLERDPLLVNERGAHDFPVMWYAALGGGSVEVAELVHALGVGVDQESHGNTALHWCVLRGNRDLAVWLIEHGADVEARGFKWGHPGHSPLQLALEKGRGEMASLLRDAGAKS